MAIKKNSSEDLKDLFSRDKLIIEELKKRLHDQLSQNPAKAKKAALIIENWLKKKPSK